MFNQKEYDKKRYQEHKEEIKEYSKQYRKNNPEKVKKAQKKWREENPEKVKKAHKKWKEENPEYYKGYNKEWIEKNPEKIKKWNEENPEYSKNYHQKHKKERNEYEKNKRKTNIQYLINGNTAIIIGHSLKGQKIGRKWETLVGYTLQKLMMRLEYQFDKNMNWENYGSYWWIDHKKPQSLFKFNSAEDQTFKDCWCLANLRPLEKIENIKKGNKFIKL